MKQPQHQQKAKATQRWVPKALLQAQGYYEGKASVWLPKQGQKQVTKPLPQAHQLPPKSSATSSQRRTYTITPLASKTITEKPRRAYQSQPHKTGSIFKKAQWLLQLLQAKLVQDRVVDCFANACQAPLTQKALQQPKPKPGIITPTKRFPKLHSTLTWVPKSPP